MKFENYNIFIGTELINVRWYSGPNAPNVAPQVQSVATVHFFIVHAQVCMYSNGGTGT